MLSVVDYFMIMSFAAHANFKLRDLNYDSFHIEIIPSILTIFNDDVLFELPPLVNPNAGHSS
jgi:capsular polysaccharide biosynthesis protein